jgi:hypothetical protein
VSKESAKDEETEEEEIRGTKCVKEVNEAASSGEEEKGVASGQASAFVEEEKEEERYLAVDSEGAPAKQEADAVSPCEDLAELIRTRTGKEVKVFFMTAEQID